MWKVGFADTAVAGIECWLCLPIVRLVMVQGSSMKLSVVFLACSRNSCINLCTSSIVCCRRELNHLWYGLCCGLLRCIAVILLESLQQPDVVGQTSPKAKRNTTVEAIIQSTMQSILPPINYVNVHRTVHAKGSKRQATDKNDSAPHGEGITAGSSNRIIDPYGVTPTESCRVKNRCKQNDRISCSSSGCTCSSTWQRTCRRNAKW